MEWDWVHYYTIAYFGTALIIAIKDDGKERREKFYSLDIFFGRVMVLMPIFGRLFGWW